MYAALAAEAGVSPPTLFRFQAVPFIQRLLQGRGHCRSLGFAYRRRLWSHDRDVGSS